MDCTATSINNNTAWNENWCWLVFCLICFQLSRVNESLMHKTNQRNEYDQTIQETEAAYMKVRWLMNTWKLLNRLFVHVDWISLVLCNFVFQILESSQTLLHVLKRETVNLSKKKPPTVNSHYEEIDTDEEHQRGVAEAQYAAAAAGYPQTHSSNVSPHHSSQHHQQQYNNQPERWYPHVERK